MLLTWTVLRMLGLSIEVGTIFLNISANISGGMVMMLDADRDSTSGCCPG